jgi:hypothetical protein
MTTPTPAVTFTLPQEDVLKKLLDDKQQLEETIEKVSEDLKKASGKKRNSQAQNLQNLQDKLDAVNEQIAILSGPSSSKRNSGNFNQNLFIDDFCYFVKFQTLQARPLCIRTLS